MFQQYVAKKEIFIYPKVIFQHFLSAIYFLSLAF